MSQLFFEQQGAIHRWLFLLAAILLFAESSILRAADHAPKSAYLGAAE